MSSFFRKCAQKSSPLRKKVQEKSFLSCTVLINPDFPARFHPPFVFRKWRTTCSRRRSPPAFRRRECGCPPAGRTLPAEHRPCLQSQMRQYSLVVGVHLFRILAVPGQVVGTGGTQTVCPVRQHDPRVGLPKQPELLPHVPGKGIAVAVAAEERRTQPVVGTQLIHGESDASAAVSPAGSQGRSWRSPAE